MRATLQDPAVAAELLHVYGFSVDISHPLTAPSPFYYDLVAIFQALHVVTNNAPGSIGGGGKPIGPIAPPLCDM
jgi:hypothetical protein